MRFALGLLMVLHGFAHLPGVIVSWQLAPIEGAIYRTTLFSDRINVGDAGMRVMGGLWLISALAFGLAAYGAFTTRDGWMLTTGLASIFSLVLSALAWPDSRIGVAVNLFILAALGVGWGTGWI
jgi:hypothetical protein